MGGERKREMAVWIPRMHLSTLCDLISQHTAKALQKEELWIYRQKERSKGCRGVAKWLISHLIGPSTFFLS